MGIETTGGSSAAAGGGAGVDTTADLLRRYASGEDLSATEFGILGNHYSRIGKSLPKADRQAAKRGRAPQARADLAESLLPGFQSDQVGTVETPGIPPGDPVDGGKMLSDTIRALLGVVEKSTAKRVDRLAVKLGADDAWRSELRERSKLNPAGVDLMADTAPILAAKYGMGSEHTAEIAFGTGVLMVGTDIADLWGKLSEMEARLDEKHAREALDPKAPK